jgi:hypothetical protein
MTLAAFAAFAVLAVLAVLAVSYAGVMRSRRLG